jgi:hypothetical protein
LWERAEGEGKDSQDLTTVPSFVVSDITHKQKAKGPFYGPFAFPVEQVTVGCQEVILPAA